MAQMDSMPGPRQVFFSDGWDGYPLARERLLRQLVDTKAENPVVLGDDIHFFCVADLKLDFGDERAPTVASELVTTSISSQSWPQAELEKRLPDNPPTRFLNSEFRGYARFEVTAERMKTDLRIVESVTDPLAPDVPTIAEAGIKDMWVPARNAIFAPPKTPRDIVERFSREIQQGVKDTDVRAQYEQRGLQGIGSTPEELAGTVVREIELWKQFVRDNKIEAQ